MPTIRSRLSAHMPQMIRKLARRLWQRPPVDADTAMAAFVRASDVFDGAWYMQKYPDVAKSGMDPAFHYAKYGAKEGRCASELFDGRYYLNTNRDVAISGMNPLFHFCKYGRDEMRSPSAKFDTAWYWLLYLAENNPSADPLADYIINGHCAENDSPVGGRVTSGGRDRVHPIVTRLLGAVDRRGCAFAIRLGMACSRVGLPGEAVKALQFAANLSPDSAKVRALLATVLTRKGRWWEAVQSWVVVTQLDSSRASWFFYLADAQEHMNQFELAAEAYQQASDLDPTHSDWYYRMGYMWERSAHRELAETAYASAVELSTRKDVKEFGVAALHQLRGYWLEAAQAYASQLTAEPLNAELHYRLGMACDRCYQWRDAEQHYRDAISLKPSVPYWHYRFGFALERQERYDEAANAYRAAAMLSPEEKSYWWYRCGYVLALVGKRRDACLAYINTGDADDLDGVKVGRQSGREVDARELDALSAYLSGLSGDKLLTEALADDATNAGTWYQLGVSRERRGDLVGAADAYRRAVARASTHQKGWYYRLGFVLFGVGLVDEACEAFRETSRLRHPYGVSTDAYAKDPELFCRTCYREHTVVLPLNSQTILYESTHGESIGGNPYAIFEQLVADHNYATWTHVWVITKDAIVPPGLKSLPNLVLVEYGSDLYARYLAVAGYLVNDTSFPYWFSRRDGQRYLNTWHGTPLKTLGKSIRDASCVPHRNIQRNLLQATHLISPNRHTSDVIMDDFAIRGIFSGKLAELGYPRVDKTINASKQRIAKIKRRLGVESSRPVVLYTPTWRGSLNDSVFDVKKLCHDLQKLATLPCEIVFRGHPFSEQALEGIDMPVYLAGSDVDTADVLAITDILVTDYSSIAFDFLPLRRPIFYYCFDLDEYERSRGMYFSMTDMPGKLCRTIDDLIDGLSRQLDASVADTARFDEAIKSFCPDEDGHATARAVAFFFGDDDTHVVDRYRDDRPSMLLFGGHFAPNGITSSFLNFVSALAKTRKYRITIAVEPNKIADSPPEYLDNFHRLPPDVTVIGRAGGMATTPEQRWVATKFRARRELPSPAMKAVFQQAYCDEARRCFGATSFDVCVDYDGYNPYWTALFGFGDFGARNACWLHSDLKNELLLRYPFLRSQLTLFPAFDALVSVSEEVNEANRTYLNAAMDGVEHLFTWCGNLIGVESIQRKAEEPLQTSIEEWLDGHVTIGTLGRLSPEKGHAKLISAFAMVVERTGTDLRLAIAGDGPLKQQLQRQINELGLSDRVRLLGHTANPYPLLARLDLFAFSSSYEGQGLAVMEALTLKKKVVSTDVVGPHGILDGGFGLLVGDNAAALADGIVAALERQTSYRPFDAIAYDKKVLSRIEVVLFPDQTLALRRRKSDMQLVAHRGGGGLRVENTLAAFENAIDLGVAGAELDVHLSRDGLVVVHHDDVLNDGYCRHVGGDWIGPDERLPLAELSYQQMLEYEIGVPKPETHFARSYDRVKSVDGQHIPLLRDVIRLAKARSDSFRLVVEIKASVLEAASRPWEALVDATLTVIREEDFVDRTILCSFDWGSLLYALGRCPEIPTWFTTSPLSWFGQGQPPREDIPPRASHLEAVRALYATGDAPWFAGFDPRRFDGSFPQAIAAAGGSAWFPYYRDCTPTVCQELAQCGLVCAAWSVNLRDRKAMADLALAGVGHLVMDYPDIDLGV